MDVHFTDAILGVLIVANISVLVWVSKTLWKFHERIVRLETAVFWKGH